MEIAEPGGVTRWLEQAAGSGRRHGVASTETGQIGDGCPADADYAHAPHECRTKAATNSSLTVATWV